MRAFPRILLIVLFSSLLAGAAGPATPAADEITFYQHVAWSPDGERLATSAMKVSRALWEKEQYGALGKSQFDIYVMQADGSGLARLTDNPENDLWATWWPGGRCLFFSTERNGSPAFYWIKADGSDPQRLPYDWPGIRVGEPSVSADGKKIAFMMRAGKESHIYVLGVKGDAPAPVQLTSVGPNNWGPVWSPDGTKIVFYSDRLGQGRDQVFVINADGSDERQLTDGTANNIFPSWSPDGRSILFASNREGPGQEGVYVMGADGSNLRRLLPGVRVAFARWSPDGTKLAFIAGDFPDTQIYVADADGAHPVQLTK